MTWPIGWLDQACATSMEGEIRGVLSRVDGGSYGGDMGDAFWHAPIEFKSKGKGQRCLMGGYGGFNRDLKFISLVLGWRVRDGVGRFQSKGFNKWDKDEDALNAKYLIFSSFEIISDFLFF